MVYIIASQRGANYVVVTSDLFAGVWKHNHQAKPGSFTARYGCNK